ncbi:hypothetical protein NIES2100_77460 [Calothrix sp. NIES-2100]|uniref:hypothetical protein n=1 Tax=Calothrix sp. NIES-2100 TaxID=1954172 RepID=UPI000B6025A6|nr:hypothetical protein NIES2100_77460 [Calothrix sp. NIES-2100]
MSSYETSLNKQEAQEEEQVKPQEKIMGKQALDFCYSHEQASLDKTTELKAEDDIKPGDNQNQILDNSANIPKENNLSEAPTKKWISLEKIDPNQSPLEVQQRLATLLERNTDAPPESTLPKQPERNFTEVKNEATEPKNLEVKTPEQLQAEAKEALPKEYHNLLDGAKILSVRTAEEVNQELKAEYLQNPDNKPERWQNPYKPGTKVVEMISGEEIEGSHVHGVAKETNQENTNQTETVSYKSMDHVSDAYVKEGTHMRIGRINPPDVPIEGEKINDKETQATRHGEKQPVPTTEKNTGYQAEVFLKTGKEIELNNIRKLREDLYN